MYSVEKVKRYYEDWQEESDERVKAILHKHFIDAVQDLVITFERANMKGKAHIKEEIRKMVKPIGYVVANYMPLKYLL